MSRDGASFDAADQTSQGGSGASTDALRDWLLHDADGDGFADALRYPVWLATGRTPSDLDAAVESAAELLAVLGARALHLTLDVRTWPSQAPGFALGPAPPTMSSTATDAPAGTVLHAEGTARLTWSGAGFVARADTAADVYRAVTTWLDARTRPGASQRPAAVNAVTTFASRGGAPEALLVAVRAALTEVDAIGRLVTPYDQASIRTSLDTAIEVGTWQIRASRRGRRTTVDLVGHDAEALGLACRWYATHYPRLPDGTWLDDLEQRLTGFVRAGTRDGRVAAAAAAARRARRSARRPTQAELPSPPAASPRWLGLPVRNSARDGELRRWSFRRAWEGERLLACATELAADLAGDGSARTQRVSIEAYASESAAVRADLARRLAARVERAGLHVDAVRVRHAYRPALHWLLEEIEPQLPAGCRRLRINVGRAGAGDGATDRWLRELYPVAELIEARRPELRVDLELGPEQRLLRYVALALGDDGRTLSAATLEPPLAASPLPLGPSVPAATGGLRLLVDDRVVAERLLPTDAEAFWTWFAREVIPALAPSVGPGSVGSCHEIAVVADLSEPDDVLAIDHETDSVLESLHEEVYFGLLEAFELAHGSAAPRQLNPGRILPFVRARPMAESRAQVTVRAWGSDRIGVTTADGGFVAAPVCDATVALLALQGRGVEVETLRLGVDQPAALERLAWASRACPATFPAGLRISLEAVDHGTSPISVGPFAAPPTRARLPPRPLHPREVLAQARSLAARTPSMRLALPHESVLGQALPVLELGLPAGPSVSQARRAAWKPTVLVSCRQHANEATSTNAAFDWLADLLDDQALLRRANVVVHPLENPDGARLHAALCALAPNHMHHAARYTAFGADLQTEPRIRGETIGESRLRQDTAARWRPLLHVNDHGYPAHAWVRSQTGFVPRGFEDWSLPVGYLTIVSTHVDDATAAALQRQLVEAAAKALGADAGIRDRTHAQVARSLRYRPFANVPFTYRDGFPFWLQRRPRPAAIGGSGPPQAIMTPLVTVITEVPDETVAGDHWDACVRAHVAVNTAVLRSFLDWHAATGDARA